MNPIKWSNESLSPPTTLANRSQVRWTEDEHFVTSWSSGRENFPWNFPNHPPPLIVCLWFSILFEFLVPVRTSRGTIIIKCGNQKRTCQFPPEEREIKSHHHYNGRERILLNRKLRESSTGHVPVCSELRLKLHLQNYLLWQLRCIFLVFGTVPPIKEELTWTLLVECFCGSSEWACWIRSGKGSPLPEPISFWMAVYWW